MTTLAVQHDVAALSEEFADLVGIEPREAIILALREAIQRRREAETPQETAARLRAEFGIALTDQARKALPKSVFDDLSE